MRFKHITRLVLAVLTLSIAVEISAQEKNEFSMAEVRVARVRNGIFLYSNWDAPYVTLDTCLDMSITSAVIPEAIESNGRTYPVAEIGPNSFNGCRRLTTVEIKGRVGILKGAFHNCPSLRIIKLNSPKPTTIGEHWFYNGNWDEVFEPYHALTVVLVVPPGTEETYRKAPGWREFKTIQSTMPDNIELKVDELTIRINEVESQLDRARNEVERLETELDALKRAQEDAK